MLYLHCSMNILFGKTQLTTAAEQSLNSLEPISSQDLPPYSVITIAYQTRHIRTETEPFARIVYIRKWRTILSLRYVTALRSYRSKVSQMSSDKKCHLAVTAGARSSTECGMRLAAMFNVKAETNNSVTPDLYWTIQIIILMFHLPSIFGNQ